MMAKEGRQGLGVPVYVLANQGNSFAETLGNAVGFRFDEHVSFRFVADFVMQIHSMPQRDDSNRLTRVLNAIEKSAFSYMELYGRPAVIVIDSVDWLQKNMPATLERLQVIHCESKNMALYIYTTLTILFNFYRAKQLR